MANGLDDVVAAETVLSDVDGLAGRLMIRGHSLAELAGRWTLSRRWSRLLLDGFFDDLPGDAELAARSARRASRCSSGVAPDRCRCWRRSTSTAPCAPASRCCPTATTWTDALRLIAAPRC